MRKKITLFTLLLLLTTLSFQSCIIFSITKNKDSTISEHDQKIFDNAYILNENQIVVSDIPYEIKNEATKLVSIERLPNETRVTLAYPIHFVSNWISTESECYAMIDKISGDKYFVRKVENNIPLNRVLIVRNHKHQMVELTYIFPPLNPEVKVVDFKTDCENRLELPSNAATDTPLKNIHINEYTKNSYKEYQKKKKTNRIYR